MSTMSDDGVAACPAPSADLDEIRQFLVDAGVSPARVEGLQTGAALRDALLEYRLLGNEPRRTLAETAERFGLTPAELHDIWVGIGMPAPDEHKLIFSAADDAVLQSFVTARTVFGTENLLRFTRVFGSAVTRITEAAFSLFTISVEDPLVQKGASDLDITLAADDAVRTMDVLPDLFVGMLKRNALHAIRRLNAAHGNLPSHDQLMVTVGFADLVGSTRWTARQGPAELAQAIGRFEQIAQESLHGQGRLVKMIGDEAMFVTVGAADGCRTALAIVDAVGREDSLPDVRVGLATGLTVVLDGDYYGTEVNRAARLVASAEPSQVVVSGAVVDAASADPLLSFVPIDPAALEGLGTEPRFALAFEPRDER